MVRFIRAALAAFLLMAPAAAFGQAQIGSGQVWGNASAAQKPGKSETVTAILDRALGATRGSIIERGASGWALVGPGTTDKPWVSNGVGADPAYQTLGIAGGGTNCAAASGTCLDNITGFSSTGLLQRTGAGAYSFICSTFNGACLDTLSGFSSTGYLKRTGAGAYSFVSPIPVADGGTNCSAASGTCLDNITGFSSTGYMRRTGAGAYAFSLAASAAQYLAGTATNVPIEPSVIYQAETTTTFGATTTFDFSTFINTRVTLTANITTMNVSNVTAGKAGHIVFKQSGAGSFTTVFNSIFKFAGGTTPSLTTGSTTAEDVLFYDCTSATVCYASLNKDMK